MMTPLDVLRATERHMASEIAVGLTTIDGARDAEMPSLVGRLRTLIDVTMDMVTATNEHLSGDVPWSIEQRQELAKVVKASMKSDIVGGAKKMV